MHLKTKTSLFLLGIFTFSLFARPNKEVIGYYPGWRQYDRDFLVNPTAIDYSKFTIINFAFMEPHEDGTITTFPNGATDDLAILKGERIWWPEGWDSTSALYYCAHQQGTKVLASIGGWSLSEPFPVIAASSSIRQTFADECVRIIDEYHFDGIDIDWEYPGYAEHGGSDADRDNFTLLLQAIRNALDAHESETGDEYLLTSCFPADPAKVEDIDVPAVSEILDFLNIMTYDFNGAFGDTVNHNSPLYAPAYGDSTFCLDAAFRLYRDEGAPVSKINVGVAFYGRSYRDSDEMYGPNNSTNVYGDIITWPSNTYEGIPPYHDIMNKWDELNMQRYWDDQAKVPYAVYDGGILSYDDEESIGLKAEYVVDNDAAGVIIWEITGDYFADGSTPLLDKLNDVFGNSQTIAQNPDITEKAFADRPVIMNREGTLTVNLSGTSPTLSDHDLNMDIFDMKGAVIRKLKPVQTGQNNSLIIKTDNLSSGRYFLRIKSRDMKNRVFPFSTMGDK